MARSWGEVPMMSRRREQGSEGSPSFPATSQPELPRAWEQLQCVHPNSRDGIYILGRRSKWATDLKELNTAPGTWGGCYHYFIGGGENINVLFHPLGGPAEEMWVEDLPKPGATLTSDKEERHPAGQQLNTVHTAAHPCPRVSEGENEGLTLYTRFF